MSTVIIAGMLAVVVVLIIRGMIKDKKSGKGCCGDCSHCSGCRHQ